jgi:hypothetical protein
MKEEQESIRYPIVSEARGESKREELYMLLIQNLGFIILNRHRRERTRKRGKE